MQLGGLATGALNLFTKLSAFYSHPNSCANKPPPVGRRWRWYLGSQVSSGRGYARVLPESWSMPWWRPTRLPLVWLSLVGDLTGSLVAGNVYRYEDHVLEPNVIQYRRVGMWTARDAPARGSPGKPGASSVAIDLQLSRPRAERPGLVQVLVFRSATPDPDPNPNPNPNPSPNHNPNPIPNPNPDPDPNPSRCSSSTRRTCRQ